MSKKPGQKLVLITGASSGIGRATAERYGKNDAHVLLLARNAERALRFRSDIDTQIGRDGYGLLRIDLADLTPSDN